MKALFTLSLFLITASTINAQFVRAFNERESLLNSKRTSNVYLYDGNIMVSSLEKNSLGNYYIKTATVNEDGETSDYKMSQEIILTGSDYLFLGCGINSDNKIIFSLSTRETTVYRLHYIQYDYNSNQIELTQSDVETIKSGYWETADKGDSLITYITYSATNEFGRFATSKEQIQNNAFIPITVDLPTTAGAEANGYTMQIDVAGNEYLAYRTGGIGSLLKFSIDYTYQSLALPNMTTSSTTGIGFDIMDNGKMAIVYNQYFYLINPDLSIADEGTINEFTAIMNRYIKVFSIGNNWIVYEQTNSNGLYSRFILDENFNLQEVQNYDDISTLTPVSVFKLPSGEVLLCGYVNKGGLFFNSLHKETGVSKPGTYIELGQTFLHREYSGNTGHKNRFFNSNLSSGFGMLHNGRLKSLIYASSNLIAGINAMGDTIGVLTRYSVDTIDYGPYTTYGLNTIENNDKYNRGYFVTRQMIDDHINYISMNNPSYKIPFGILEWPAHGDTDLGQAENIAHFYDQNTNGIYEPELGDYPLIYGDQCILNVFHKKPDLNNTDRIECHQYFYTFDCDTSDVLNNAVFVNQRFVLRGSELQEVYVGSFTDYDIGNYSDDFCGTNVETGMIYAYNGDLFDESDGGKYGFQDTVPASGLIYLRGAKLDSNLLDNAYGIGTNESINGYGFGDGVVDNEHYTMEASREYTQSNFYPYNDPSSEKELYHNLKGNFSNGLSPQVNGVDVRHSYFGNSDPLFYSSGGIDHGNNYSEITEVNANGDRRMIAGSGPMNLVGTQNTIEMVTAYLTAIDTINIGNDPLPKLFEMGSDLKAMYANNNAGCEKDFGYYVSDIILSVGVEELNELKVQIYPNPTKGEITIQMDGQEFDLEILDATGKVLNTGRGSTVYSYNLEGFDSGLYFISVKTNGVNITKKVIKL